MSRPLRIEYAGAWYHVMNRGRRREKIYLEKSDYQLFKEVLKQAINLFAIEIHAYALMPNHYHLLVSTPKGNLSRAMRHINGVYTLLYNKRKKVDGSLFRGRYKSILIEEQEYLMELVGYIHQNPIKAKLEKKFGEYRWCSHRVYMGEEKEEILTTENVLRKFGANKREAKRQFVEFMTGKVSDEINKKMKSIRWPIILGSENFEKDIREMLKDKEIDVDPKS